MNDPKKAIGDKMIADATCPRCHKVVYLKAWESGPNALCLKCDDELAAAFWKGVYESLLFYAACGLLGFLFGIIVILLRLL